MAQATNTVMMMSIVLLLVLSLSTLTSAFVHRSGWVTSSRPRSHLPSTVSPWEVKLDMPPTGSQVKAVMKIRPILSVPSEIIEVRYKVPFGLDVSPVKGLAVCTRDGPGGERVDDVLRYASYWSLSLPAGDGLLNSAATIAGGISWRCTMFDVMKAESWAEVVAALQSNVPSRTDEVVLLFERSLSGKPPELL